MRLARVVPFALAALVAGALPAVALTTTASAQPGTTPSMTVLAASTTTPVVGQLVTFTATVSPQSGPGDPTGTVTVTSSIGGTVCSMGLPGSDPDEVQCSYTYTSPGGDTVTASYGGDDTYAPSDSTADPTSITIGPASTTTTLTASDNGAGVVVGQPVTFTAQVGVDSPGSGSPTGSVDFTDTLTGGSISGCSSVTLDSATGQAACTTSYSATTTDDVTATYSGDSNFNGSSSSPATQETVSPASTTTTLSSTSSSLVSGESATFTAVVGANAPGSGNPTGTVTFTDSDGLLAGCSEQALSVVGGNDQASCTVSFPGVADSGDQVTADYNTDGNYLSSTSSSLSVTVDPDATTVVLTPSSNPADSGVLFTMSATVGANAPGSGTPTGSVTFKSGTSTLCSGHLNSSGTASCSTTFLGAGTASLTAVYGGSSNYSTATSAPVSETILQSTQLQITATPTSATYGTKVTFSGYALPLTATGTVTFSAGGTELCQATVSDGSAICSSTAVPAGSPTVVVGTYSGDANNAASSEGVSVTVSQAATHVKGHAVPSKPVFDGPLTIEATGLPTSAGGTVSFVTSTSTVLCSGIAVSGGTAACTPGSLPAGSYSVTLTYSGDSNHIGSSATVKFTVKKAPAKFTASANPTTAFRSQDITLSASGLPAVATGSVTFTTKNTAGTVITLCSGTVSGGSASCTAASGVYLGTHKVTAKYSGDANFLASSATTSFTIA